MVMVLVLLSMELTVFMLHLLVAFKTISFVNRGYFCLNNFPFELETIIYDASC